MTERGDASASEVPTTVAVARIVGTLILVGYPLFVWWGLGRFSARALGTGLAVVAIVGLVLRLPALPASERWAMARAPLAIAGLGTIAAWLDEAWALLLMPAAANAVLLVAFAVTLRAGARMTMVERFAIMSGAELDDAGRNYCRRWTWVWCIFFATNGAVCAALTVAPLAWWAAWTGVGSYAAAGCLFVAERLTRAIHHRSARA